MAKKKPSRRPGRNPPDKTGRVQDWLDRSGTLYQPDLGHEAPNFDPKTDIYGAAGDQRFPQDLRPTRIGDEPVAADTIHKGLNPLSPDALIALLTGQYGPNGQTIRNNQPIMLPGDKRLPLSNVPLSGGPTGFATTPLQGGASTLSNVPLSRTPNSLITMLPGRGITQVTNVPQRGSTQQLSHADMLKILAAHHARTQGSLVA